MSAEFAGKIAWVVGASGGLGMAISAAFVRAGAHVILSGRNATKLREMNVEPSGGNQTTVLPVDVTESSSVVQATEAIIVRHKQIDVLVNTTSVSVFGDFLALSDDDWRKVYEAKLFAYMRTMRSVLPHMLARGRGAIVNLSGNGGHFPRFPSHIAGCSGNAAVNLATKAVADLYFLRGIRANCLAPGPIRSRRLEEIGSADAAIGERTSRSVDAMQPGQDRQPGVPEDIADATLFLASDRARHINGIVLTVDGGATPTL